MSDGVVALGGSGELYGLAYARISGRKEQRDSALSIPSQNRHIDTVIQNVGAILVDRDHDILVGTRSDRPGYQRTLARVRRLHSEGKQVAVFVLRLDRFGRDGEERSRAWKELAKLGARIYSVTQGGWITDRFLYDIDAAVSQREVDLTSARVRDVNEFVRANGFPIVGRPAWGYRIRKATPEERAAGSGRAMIEPHPAEADAVRRVWEMRASGDSLGDVHRYVLALSDAETGGRSLDRATFRRMFTAAVYVARHDYPKGHAQANVPVLERRTCAWEPLVSDDLFRRVAAQTDGRPRLAKQATGQYLLTGLLRCYRCGGRMVGTPYRARERRVDGSVHERGGQRYQCVSSNLGRAWTRTTQPCSTVIVAKTLDADVRQQVGRIVALIDRPRGRRELARVWEGLRTGRKSRSSDDLGQQIARAEQHRATWVDARASAYPDWKAKRLTDREYDEIRARAEGEIDTAERELERLRARLGAEGEHLDQALPPLAVVMARLDGWGPLLETAPTAEQRGLLGELIERVEAVKVTRGRYTARIRWTERGRALRRVAKALAQAERGAEGRVGVDAFAWANNSTPTRPSAGPHAPDAAASQIPATRRPLAPERASPHPSTRPLRQHQIA
jgi:DNA invertase Pin-like site-specific DNA recombinase